jgi:hypothetical protein
MHTSIRVQFILYTFAADQKFFYNISQGTTECNKHTRENKEATESVGETSTQKYFRICYSLHHVGTKAYQITSRHVIFTIALYTHVSMVNLLVDRFAN